MLNTKDNLNKFDYKAQKYIMLGYSKRWKGYRLYNIETNIVKELIHVKFDDRFYYEKSKQVEKFAYLEIIYLNFERKDSEDKDFRSAQHWIEQ